jgi:hypothetical protein
MKANGSYEFDSSLTQTDLLSALSEVVSCSVTNRSSAADPAFGYLGMRIEHILRYVVWDRGLNAFAYQGLPTKRY